MASKNPVKTKPKITRTNAPKKEVDEHPADEAAHVEHPTDRQYWNIFFILFAVTAVEVALYYFELPGPVHINNGALGILAIAKFAVVVAYFMHLKFDNRIVRRLFITGLVLALFCYVVVLLSMGVFIDPPNERQ